MFNFIKDKWNEFQLWAASKWPGVKTKALAALGVLSSVAALFQDYITGLPLVQLVGEKVALAIVASLFTLIFWTRTLTNKS